MSNHPMKKDNINPYIRLDFLDSLRFFAIVYVVISHLRVIPEPNLMIPEWIAPFIINGGSAGVSLFFVLSAFSLSYSMDARAGEAMLTRRFYIRRFFRIVPLFYLMMLVYWIRDAAIFGLLHPVSEVLVNASLLFNLIPAFITGFVWASWTIGVLILLYLLFPLIHRYIRNLPAALTLFVASILMARGWSFFVINYGELTGYLTPDQMNYVWGFGFLQNLPMFVCGVITYRLFSDYFIKMTQKARYMAGLLFIMSFLFLYAALLTGRLQNILWETKTWQGICFSLLVLGLGLRPFSFLVNSKTVYLGKASYSMYLFHPILTFTFVPVYYWCYDHLSADLSGFSVSLLITLIPLTVISLISYKYIERPGISWGEKLISRRWPINRLDREQKSH
ncbi:MAG: acyltransferase [Smithella sp.]|jgi:peptidoglycan/LPS O-acetylase OafA/YrhL